MSNGEKFSVLTYAYSCMLPAIYLYRNPFNIMFGLIFSSHFIGFLHNLSNVLFPGSLGSFPAGLKYLNILPSIVGMYLGGMDSVFPYLSMIGWGYKQNVTIPYSGGYFLGTARKTALYMINGLEGENFLTLLWGGLGSYYTSETLLVKGMLVNIPLLFILLFYGGDVINGLQGVYIWEEPINTHLYKHFVFVCSHVIGYGHSYSEDPIDIAFYVLILLIFLIGAVLHPSERSHAIEPFTNIFQLIYYIRSGTIATGYNLILVFMVTNNIALNSQGIINTRIMDHLNYFTGNFEPLPVHTFIGILMSTISLYYYTIGYDWCLVLVPVSFNGAQIMNNVYNNL